MAEAGRANADVPTRAPLGAAELPGIALDRARRAMSRRYRQAGSRGAILLYHRIASPARDPWNLAVSPTVFARQMSIMAAEATPLGLEELATRAAAGRLPERAVAVTFDDGYLDNLVDGLPVLERHSIPASVFVASGFMGSAEPYWWDELDVLLGTADGGSDTLELTIGPWPLAFETATSAGREHALGVIQRAVRWGPPGAYAEAIAGVREWASPTTADIRQTGRPATPDELVALDASPLISLGAHTRTHPGLAAQRPDVVRREVEGSHDDLAELTGERPRTFAYPFGDRRPSTARSLRAAGFTVGVSVEPDLPVTRVSNPLALPRQHVLEGTDDEFRHTLDTLLGPPVQE